MTRLIVVSAISFPQVRPHPPPGRWYRPGPSPPQSLASSFKMAAAIGGILLAGRHGCCWASINFSRSWTWIRLGVGKGSGRRWGRTDEASEGGGKEWAFGWGRGRPRPSGRPWLHLVRVCSGHVLLGFRRRLSWPGLAEVLIEGERSDFSVGLKLPAFVAVRTIHSWVLLPSFLLIPGDLSVSALEELIRR